MRAIGLVALVAVVTGAAVACSLNPQPLPPLRPDDASVGLPASGGDTADAGSEEGGSAAGSEGGSAENDASVPANDAATMDGSDGDAKENAEAGLRDADGGTSDAASQPDSTAD